MFYGARCVPDIRVVYTPTDVKKRISLSCVQDSSTAVTFICVDGMIFFTIRWYIGKYNTGAVRFKRQK